MFKKGTIIKMENHELVSALERVTTEMTKQANFSSRGVSPKLKKQLDWIEEEILVRMR